MDYVTDLLVEDKEGDIVILAVFRRVLNIPITTLDKEESERAIDNVTTGKEIHYDGEYQNKGESDTEKKIRAIKIQMQ